MVAWIYVNIDIINGLLSSSNKPGVNCRNLSCISILIRIWGQIRRSGSNIWYLSQWFCSSQTRWLNSDLFKKLHLRQYQNIIHMKNERHFADNILKCIFLNENIWIPTKISLNYVPYGLIDNMAALVQIMAWRRPGDKPLSGPMMVRLLTHICVTQPQWVKGHGKNKEFYEGFLLDTLHESSKDLIAYFE